MLSSFLSSIVFVIFLISTTEQGAILYSNTCDPSTVQYSSCYLGMTIPSACKTSTLNIAGSRFEKSCPKTFKIDWSYPSNSFTLVIATPYTSLRKRFQIQLKNPYNPSPDFNIYQLATNGAATKTTTRNNIVYMQSDSNYQVRVLFQTVSKYTIYIKPIEYTIVQL